MKKGGAKRAGSVVITFLVALVVAWVALDAGYAHVVERRLAEWEAGIPRDANGVREGCAAFSVGEGEAAILLVHGFADSPAVFRPMAAALAEEGFHCRAMRLPGFAEAMPSYSQTSAAQWEAELEKELTALRSAYPRVYIVAHSLGGAAALRCVMDEPTAADRVVLLTPLLGVSNTRSPVLKAETWYRIARRLMMQTAVIESIFEPNFKQPDAVPPPTDRFVPTAVYDGLFTILDDIRTRPEALKTPTLVYVVPDDPVVDGVTTAAFFAKAPSDTVRCVSLERSGHVVPMDQEWRSVTEQIVRFLEPERN